MLELFVTFYIIMTTYCFLDIVDISFGNREIGEKLELGLVLVMYLCALFWPIIYFFQVLLPWILEGRAQ